jgi:tight adherence protein C
MDGPHPPERRVTTTLHGLGMGMAMTLAVLAFLLPHRPRATCALPASTAPALAEPRLAIAWLRARYAELARGRTRARAVADALPDAVDLLLLSTSAGHSLPIAHPLVASRVPSPLGAALRDAAVEADRGRPRAEALVAALTPLGGRALALAHALADHLRYGVPLAPTLDRLGSELRLDRRRRAEQDARRVPVRLLAPLVSCVLPAFALLTVVPLLAASLRSLPT